jgi:hypothetical protein
MGDTTCSDALPELEKETFVSLHERLEKEREEDEQESNNNGNNSEKG